jgi:hypothetical protein
MAKADCVLSTPRRTASKINPPVDPTRRHLLTIAAGGAVAAAIPIDVGIPTSAAAAADPDPAFALIAEKLAADVAHEKAIDAQDEAESGSGFGSDAAWESSERCSIACQAVNEADWRLATTPPDTGWRRRGASFREPDRGCGRGMARY